MQACKSTGPWPVHQSDKILAAVQERLEYRVDASGVGDVWWREKISNATNLAKPAGGANTAGYRRVSITSEGLTKLLYVHHVVVFLVDGKWPIKQVDHRDVNPRNNTRTNLRQVDSFENAQNRKAMRTNTSGTPGVSKGKNGNGKPVLQAHVTIKGHTHSKIFDLGAMKDAEQWRNNKVRELHTHAPEYLNAA